MSKAQPPQHIETIPIREIRVVNPRTRNQVTFQNIVSNINNVGLKKPITISRRGTEADGTKYDLVCGQGRLEALAALGAANVPAIVIDAPPQERHLMSLIENIARRRPSNLELVHEVRSLLARGYSCPAIADKIGVHRSYITGVASLLRKGEEQLISQVEAGVIPASIAVKIATSSSEEVQKALQEAYEAGELRGWQVPGRPDVDRPASCEEHEREAIVRKEIVREYEKQTERHRTLIRRAGKSIQQLALVSTAMKRLLGDEHFRTLLRAESLADLPELLAERLA